MLRASRTSRDVERYGVVNIPNSSLPTVCEAPSGRSNHLTNYIDQYTYDYPRVTEKSRGASSTHDNTAGNFSDYSQEITISRKKRNARKPSFFWQGMVQTLSQMRGIPTAYGCYTSHTYIPLWIELRILSYPFRCFIRIIRGRGVFLDVVKGRESKAIFLALCTFQVYSTFMFLFIANFILRLN